MPILLVHSGSELHQVDAPIDLTIRDLLSGTRLSVPSACGGIGSCGACTILVQGSSLPPPTPSERTRLSPVQLHQGYRLACQLRIHANTEVYLESIPATEHWPTIHHLPQLPQIDSVGYLNKNLYGLAVDLGTTNLRISLLNRKTGLRLASRIGPNPQIAFGSDILNRLTASKFDRQRMTRIVVASILHAVSDIFGHEAQGLSFKDVAQLTLVANTAMTAILSQTGADQLLDPCHWQDQISCDPQNPEDWRALWQLPNAEICLQAPLFGFIGSDLVADIVATNLTHSPKPSLLIDIGTNTELALWDGDTLHVTSVAGGPAFEELGIRHSHASLSGSSLVDEIAGLLRDKCLSPSGRLLQGKQDPCRIGGKDLDAFQRAKAATAAAAHLLLQRAKLQWIDISRICICGSFGEALNITNAIQVGLLPKLDLSCFEQHAQAALLGCERAVLSTDPKLLFSDITDKSSGINLSLLPAFEELFIDNLSLRPFS